MEKKEFFKVLSEYNKQRRRFRKINIGDLVWEADGWDWGSYCPLVVKSVNIDEAYIEAIEISYNNKVNRYKHFTTEPEMIKQRLRATTEEEYKEYEKKSGVKINRVNFPSYQELNRVMKKTLDSIKNR
jgi:hypothetical protein